MLYDYRAYGLRIHSAVRLPELIESERRQESADVVISVEPNRKHRTARRTDRVHVQLNGDSVVIAHPIVGTFRIDAGCSILIEPMDAPPPALLRMILLGPAFAALLRQRGLLTLHASAVEMQGEAVVFLGHTRAGKSTLAAACASEDHLVIADDVVCVETGGSRPVVFPAFPAVKLDAPSAAASGMEVQNIDEDLASLGKRYLKAAPCRLASLPLGRIFVLEISQKTSVARLAPREAFLELLRHSYGSRTLQSLDRGHNMKHCAALAGAVPVARLTRVHSLQYLPILKRIAEHAVV